MYLAHISVIKIGLVVIAGDGEQQTVLPIKSTFVTEAVQVGAQ